MSAGAGARTRKAHSHEVCHCTSVQQLLSHKSNRGYVAEFVCAESERRDLVCQDLVLNRILFRCFCRVCARALVRSPDYRFHFFHIAILKICVFRFFATIYYLFGTWCMVQTGVERAHLQFHQQEFSIDVTQPHSLFVSGTSRNSHIA